MPVLLDAHGAIAEDRRDVAFRLPAGVTDPFARPAPAEPASTTFHGFVFEHALQHSNAGGAYLAREESTGRQVVIKEARAHTGLTWDGRAAPYRLRREWDTMRALHAIEPGLCPEPIAMFREWEHDFMVQEHIDGIPLKSWVVAHSTLIRSKPTGDEVADYHARCEKILAGVERAFARLHVLGYVFVDVNPGNVIVTEGDGVRLVDFEAAHRVDETLPPMGAEGFTPPRELVSDDPLVFDDYGLAALAQFMLAPLQQGVQRNPDVLAHLRYDLAELGPVPQALWAKAIRFHRPGADPVLPGPEQVAADPDTHLRDLADRVATGLAAMAEPGHPDRVYPTIPQGFASNTLCVAYGTAGVVHALRRSGRPVPDDIVARLRRDTVRSIPDLAPGLLYGLAGIAWVLADLGHVDEAVDLLAEADRHPLVGARATYGSGSAGLAMAHLALYGHTRREHHIDRAAALAAGLPDGQDLIALLGPDDATGLLEGRCGIALMMQQLAGVTGDVSLRERGTRLLHAELDRASDPDADDLAFPVSATDSRSMPYLYCGSAGMVMASTRYLRDAPDERLAEALPRLLLRIGGLFTVMPGLYQGLSGLGLATADHARLTGDHATRATATRTARALCKYAVPHEDGVRFLGEFRHRFSADLWSGSAGVLLFLSQLLDPRPDPLFTVDELAGVQAHESGVLLTVVG